MTLSQYVDDLEKKILQQNTKIKYLCNNLRITQEEHEASLKKNQAIYRDLGEETEKQRAALQAQLAQAKKMETMGRLAGGIAHDFNNILVPIIGYSEMVLRDVPSGSSAEMNIQQVLKAANRARDLANRILTFSRQGEQRCVPVRIDAVVKEVLQLLLASIPPSVEIRQNIMNRGFEIKADSTQIHQVLMNLCTNACDAMSENGGVLEVGLDDCDVDEEFASAHLNLEEGHYVRLTVKDTGQGIDTQNMSRIFEPFFTTKDLGKGTGLGLSVVHGIIMNHKGEILVDSEPGKGTCFQIYLPCLTGPASIVPVDEFIPSTVKTRILFVDDEEEIVEMTQLLLGGLGYDVTTRTSSVDALELFQSRPQSFDVVITDQMMPEMTGTDLARELLNTRPDLPIILITGYRNSVTAEACQKLGISDLLLKPIPTKEFDKAIRKAIGES